MRSRSAAARVTIAAGVALGLVLGWTTSALAHPLAPALLDVREAPDGAVDVLFKEPSAGAPASRLRAVLPAGCDAVGRSALRRSPEDAGLVAAWKLRCAGGLAGKSFGVTGLGAGTANALLRVSLADGSRVERVLSQGLPFVAVPAQRNRIDVARDYFRLGAEHIATGADHLLFVLGLLLLLGVRRSLAFAVTGFTLGHSVTLSAAIFGYAPLPARVVEVGIALSVLLLAVELARTRPAASLFFRFPVVLSAAFGLLHGFGFAGALRGLGLPVADAPLALFAFNGGIEAGQLAFLVAAIGVVAVCRRLPLVWPRWTARVPVYAMGSLATFWTLERALALFGRAALGGQ